MTEIADSSPALPRLRARTAAGRLAGIALGIGLAWLLLEVLLRATFALLPPGLQGAIENVRRIPWDDATLAPEPPFIPDTDYQNIMPPDLKDHQLYFSGGHFAITTISLWEGRVGMRSDPPRWPVDIAVVGDSFTVCFTGFADCWVERLHRDFGWSVMNLGQRGTGTRAHLHLLKTFGVPLQPRVVIWQWYGNDFNEDYGFALLRGEMDEIDAPPAPVARPDFGPLADYSAVYALVRDRLWQARQPLPSSWTEYNRYAFDLTRESNQIGWEMSVAALDEAHRIVEDDMGAALVIVLVPTKEEVHPEFVEEASDPVYVATLSQGRQNTLDLCVARGWHCVDVTGALRAAADSGQEVYYRDDPHTNPRGNRIMAQVAAGYLIKHGLLASPPE